MEDAVLSLQQAAGGFGGLSDDGSDTDSIWSDDASMDEVAGSLKTDVECLMDMGPRFRDPLPNSVADPDPAKNQDAHPDSAEAPWDPVKLFSDRIKTKFPKCHPNLVFSCSKSVYDTLLRLHECRERATIPEVPQKRMHDPPDSALGTSLTGDDREPPQPRVPLSGGASLAGDSKAPTIFSFIGEDGNTRARFPSQPKDVSIGQPFSCMGCGRRVVKSQSTRSWKYDSSHFLSLLLYFPPCAFCDLVTFRNRVTNSL